MEMLAKTIVSPPPEGKTRKVFECPGCMGKRLRKLTSAEVFLRGEYPAPQVEVRECKDCGTLSERDKWIEDRMFWKGML